MSYDGFGLDICPEQTYTYDTWVDRLRMTFSTNQGHSVTGHFCVLDFSHAYRRGVRVIQQHCTRGKKKQKKIRLFNKLKITRKFKIIGQANIFLKKDYFYNST